MATLGFSAPAVEQHYTRAQALCAQLGNSPQRVPMLWGLWMFQATRGDLRAAQTLAEECLQIAERTNEAELLLEAHLAAGSNFLLRGEFTRARGEIEQSIAFYQPQHQALTPLYGGYNPKVMSLAFTSWMLWSMGSPDQARTRDVRSVALGTGSRPPL